MTGTVRSIFRMRGNRKVGRPTRWLVFVEPDNSFRRMGVEMAAMREFETEPRLKAGDRVRFFVGSGETRLLETVIPD